MSKRVFRILDRANGKPVAVYMPPSAHDVTDFPSAEAAANSNCHGIYANEAKYEIAEFEVTYRRIN